MRSLQHVLIVSRSTIMLFTLFLYRCWNIFGKLDSLEYVSFISHLLFLDSNIDLSHQALTLPTSPKAHLRPLGLGTLTALLMFEAYNTLTIQFVIPPLGDNSKMLMVKTFLKSFFFSGFTNEKKKPFLSVTRCLRTNATPRFSAPTFNLNHPSLPPPPPYTHSQHRHPLSSAVN